MIFPLKNIIILSWSSIHINDIFVPTLFLCGIVTYYILYFVISSNDLTLHGDIFVIVFCCTGCTLAWNVLLPAGLRVAQPCRYCFYSVVEKQVFRPAGATRCPDKREIWHGGGVPNFTFIGAEMWEYSPQNCKNFDFGQKFVLYKILSICTRL